MRLASLAFALLLPAVSRAGTFPFTKQPIARDQILELAHLYYGIRWRCDPENAYGTSIAGAECPYGTESGWKDALPYCWAGADEIYEYLVKMTSGLGAGDKDTSTTSPYYGGLVGSVDCSGYASQCFRSGRYTTASFYQVSADVGWDNLAPGDATNNAGSHIRLCEKYPTETGLILVYESTGSGWQVRHRLLSRDNNYAGIRYTYTSPLPSLLDAVRTAPGEVTLSWFGQAATGFRVYRSPDGAAWTLAADEGLLDPDSGRAVLSGLAEEELHYFRVAAVNGAVESAPSTVFPVRFSNADRPSVLLVHAYDRWIRRNPANAFNSFLARYADALDSAGIRFETCDNFRVTRGEIRLSDYDAVIWMAGDESTQDYALNFLEEIALRSYLRGGGCLFISGSEIGWDLVAREQALDNLEVDDSDFYRDFLKAGFVADDAASYTVSGVPGTVFGGLSLSFDDGTHGTYDVEFPDVLTAVGGASVCLTYGTGGGAAVVFDGVFDGGTAPGKVVYLGFPFETLYPEEARRALMQRAMAFFFGTATLHWQIY